MEVESRVAPGVKYVVRRLNQQQRVKRELPIAEHRARMQKLYYQARETQDDLERQRLDLDAGVIFQQHIKPAVLEFGIVSISGVVDDSSQPVDLRWILSNGGPESDPLLDEMFEACDSLTGLQPDTAKNLQSDGTSSAAVHPIATPMTAESVAG